MGITDMIAGFIQEALDDAGGVLEMQRGDLAQRFGCVPSQINYVMSTGSLGARLHRGIPAGRRRLRPHHRVHVDRQTLMMHVINSIGSEIDPASARAILSNLVQSEAIPAQTGKLLVSLLSDARSAIRSQGSAQRPAGRPAEAGPHPSGIASDRYS